MEGFGCRFQTGGERFGALSLYGDLFGNKGLRQLKRPLTLNLRALYP